jgi:hypothetical protein
MNNPKLCKDCKHCVPLTGGFVEKDYSLARCERAVSGVDLVTGRVKRGFCETERMIACGKEARFFEPLREEAK